MRYQEEYKLALESLNQASLLDPTWEVPKEKQTELLKYLRNVQNSVNTKGSVKPKKLFQMLQVIIFKVYSSNKNIFKAFKIKIGILIKHNIF